MRLRFFKEAMKRSNPNQVDDVRMVAGLAAALALMTAGELASSSDAAEGRGRTVWDGVYTEAQATRGQAILTEQCATCHGEAMRGGGGVPSAVGPEFMFNWKGKTVSELFMYLKTTMPPTAPGSLSDQKYADAMGALFKHNGFPASDIMEIPPDQKALVNVTIESLSP